MGDQCLEVIGIWDRKLVGYCRIWGTSLTISSPMLQLPRGLIEEGGVIYYEGSGLPSLNVFI